MLSKRQILPPLDYLVAFESAAVHGSFAAAARDMNISETAISRKVRLLEQHYGVALFVRGHRSISLTQQGLALRDQVLSAMDILRDASTDLLSGQHRNTLTLAATNSVASLWLMPRLRRFNKANQRVKIMLVASDSDDECLSDTVDLAILRGDGDWPGYSARMLFGETIFPVCAPGYLKRNSKASEAADLINHDLIEVASTHTEWMNWKTWLGHIGIRDAVLDRSALFNTYPLSIQAAVDGLGVALGWGHLVDPLLDSGELIRPVPGLNLRTKSGYYLLKRDGLRGFPELEIVENWLLKQSAARRRYGTKSDNIFVE